MGVTNPITPRGRYLDEYPLTLDGTSQELVPNGGAILYFMVQNPTGNGTIKVNLLGGDALLTGFEIPGGGSLEMAAGVTNGAITVSGTLGEEVYAVASTY
jgi:hypothetical protein